MRFDEYLVEPHALRSAQSSGASLAFVDLATSAEEKLLGHLPPCPVIGIGDAAHPLARSLDAVVEHPITAAALIRQILLAPHAAAVAVQLLRAIDAMPVEAALIMESLAYGLLQSSVEHVAWLAARPPASPLSPAGRVIVDRQGDHLDIILDRAEARNAINTVLRDQLYEAFTVAKLDPDVRSISLRAAGPVFSLGGDLGEFGSTRDPATAHCIRSATSPALPLSARADILDVHVQGACVGSGLEMAAFASRITAAPNAWFQLPELGMGLIPGAGGCVSLSRRIGRQRAALMILSGRRLNAATALKWGIVDAIVDRPPILESGANPLSR